MKRIVVKRLLNFACEKGNKNILKYEMSQTNETIQCGEETPADDFMSAGWGERERCLYH